MPKNGKEKALADGWASLSRMILEEAVFAWLDFDLSAPPFDPPLG